MDLWLFTVLLFLLATQALEVVSSLLNIRAIKPHPPRELADLYDKERYDLSIAYIRANIVLTLIQGLVTTAAVIVFIVTGGFHALDIHLRMLVQQELFLGLLFIGIILLLMFFLDLPFSLYRTFVIEERFGFNRTTPLLYVSDLAKIIMLAILLGGPLLAFVLWFFANAGSFAWLYSWLAVSLFSIILNVLAPVVILPLFNKLTPLDESTITEAVQAYAKKQQFSLQGIFTMDGSKRSTKANAFFTGFGRTKKVVFFDTLLQHLSTQEVVAVLAHEIGHYKLHHLTKNLVVSLLQSFAMFYVLSLFIEIGEISKAFSMEHVSLHASFVFFGLLFSPASLILSLVANGLSRRHEYAADHFARGSLESVNPFISALKKLSSTNFSHLTPHPLTVWLHYSHPPLVDRIARLSLPT